MPESARWREFATVAVQPCQPPVVRTRWQSGRVAIEGDWDAYRSAWSRKHRQHMTRGWRRLKLQGKPALRLLTDFAPDEAREAMCRGLEIENLGWKGAAATSVLKTPGMEDAFLSQAEWLAANGHLELAFLELDGKPIAFIYGQTAKGVFHSAKIGYDPAYADCSPGQLLRYLLLERLFSEKSKTAFDFLGPLTESHAAWHPSRYTVGRMAVSLGGAMGNFALAAYRRWRRRKKSSAS